MSDPNSTPSDPKPENAKESGSTTPGPYPGEPNPDAPSGEQQTAPSEQAPATEQAPAAEPAPSPSASEPARLNEPRAPERQAGTSEDAAAAAKRTNSSLPPVDNAGSQPTEKTATQNTEAYPYAAAPPPAHSSSDHTVTEAYSDSTPTEHVITGPEPTRTYDTRGPAAGPGAPWPGSAQHVEVAEEPKRKGNRWAGIGIGIIQALIFAAAMFGVLILLDVLAGEPLDLLGIVLSPALLISVGMFFIALVIVALLVNRAGWWAWILGGLLIAAFAYAGWIGGLLVQEASTVPSNRVLEFIWDNVLTWPAIAAFILGREVPIWFGAWTSARGRRVAKRNRAARDDYERQLDEGDAAYR